MSKKKKKNKQQPKRNFMVAFLVLAMIAFVASQIPWNKMSRSTKSSSNINSSRTTANTNSTKNLDKPFNAQSSVSIVRQNNDKPIKVDVELALSKQEINLGLMYRKSLPDHGGMLFVMAENKDQSFWMKNTYVPLDIIYISTDKKIVSIAKNAVPLDETPLPSNGVAKYVLEVNAGFSDAYGLQTGDQLKFNLNQ